MEKCSEDGKHRLGLLKNYYKDDGTRLLHIMEIGGQIT